MTRALLATAVLAFASSVTTADTSTVCLDGSCDYSNIQQAVNAASDGDVIIVQAGTYTGTGDNVVDTLGKSLELRGGRVGAALTIDSSARIRFVASAHDVDG